MLALDVWLIGVDFNLLNCVETGRVINAKTEKVKKKNREHDW